MHWLQYFHTTCDCYCKCLTYLQTGIMGVLFNNNSLLLCLFWNPLLCVHIQYFLVVRRGFMPQITFVSCCVCVWLWPAYKQFGAELLWGCITQSCNCVCAASSLWANATIKDAPQNMLVLQIACMNSIKQWSAPSILSVSAYRHRHMMGALTGKSYFLFSTLPQDSCSVLWQT